MRTLQAQFESNQPLEEDVEADKEGYSIPSDADDSGTRENSSFQILGELAMLPKTLDARQWVAFSGLDPAQFSSGTSVEKKSRISRGGSRHLRRALYMPALVAIRREPFVRSFYFAAERPRCRLWWQS